MSQQLRPHLCMLGTPRTKPQKGFPPGGLARWSDGSSAVHTALTAASLGASKSPAQCIASELSELSPLRRDPWARAHSNPRVYLSNQGVRSRKEQHEAAHTPSSSPAPGTAVSAHGRSTGSHGAAEPRDPTSKSPRARDAPSSTRLPGTSGTTACRPGSTSGELAAGTRQLSSWRRPRLTGQRPAPSASLHQGSNATSCMQTAADMGGRHTAFVRRQGRSLGEPRSPARATPLPTEDKALPLLFLLFLFFGSKRAREPKGHWEEEKSSIWLVTLGLPGTPG